jgi:hypothetical protein
MTLEIKSKTQTYPTLGEDVYNEILRVCKEEGYLQAEIASMLNVSEGKLLRWRQIDEKLDEVMTLGHTHSKAWWQSSGRRHVKTGKDFQFNIWIATMKNCFDYGDRPSERPFRAVDWEGGVEAKIEIMDEWLRQGKCTVELYEHMMKSLHYHSQINEVCYVKPHLERLDLERKLACNEISQAEFDKSIELWEESRRIREVAIERILKRERILSHYDKKQKVKTKKTQTRGELVKEIKASKSPKKEKKEKKEKKDKKGRGRPKKK